MRCATEKFLTKKEKRKTFRLFLKHWVTIEMSTLKCRSKNADSESLLENVVLWEGSLKKELKKGKKCLVKNGYSANVILSIIWNLQSQRKGQKDDPQKCRCRFSSVYEFLVKNIYTVSNFFWLKVLKLRWIFKSLYIYLAILIAPL